MHFCPQCGSQLFPAARFCAACGENLAELEAAAARAPVSDAPNNRPTRPADAFALGPFIAVFGALLGFGVLMAYLILRQLPARENLLASAPPSATSADLTSAASTSADDAKFPPGHP